MEIVLINDDAIIPTRASKRSAGLDLYSSIDINIEVGSIKKINIGIRVSLPENSYGSIRDKSSLAAKGLYRRNYCNNDFFNRTNKKFKKDKK